LKHLYFVILCRKSK